MIDRHWFGDLALAVLLALPLAVGVRTTRPTQPQLQKPAAAAPATKLALAERAPRNARISVLG